MKKTLLGEPRISALVREIIASSISRATEWSERRMREGVSSALIAHLDATSMCLLPEDVASVKEQAFEELLEDLKAEIGDKE
jgi:hypothetical protein